MSYPPENDPALPDALGLNLRGKRRCYQSSGFDGVVRKTGLPCGSNHRYTSIFAELFMTAIDESDPLAPQREAAFFYGLFLRGHNVEALRQDIDVPRSMLDKWMKAPDFEADFRQNLRRLYTYRKQVLAIFDGLVLNEQNRPPVQ
jgi:hypothetical protein